MASFLTSFHFSVTLNKDSFNFLPVLHDHHIILPSAHFLITVRPKSAVKSSNDSEKLVTYLEEKYVSKKLRKTVKLVAKQLTQLYFFLSSLEYFFKNPIFFETLRDMNVLVRAFISSRLSRKSVERLQLADF